VIQHVLDHLTYAGKDSAAIGEVDRKIRMTAPEFLKLHKTD